MIDHIAAGAAGQQLSLFDDRKPPSPRQSHGSATSAAAATSIAELTPGMRGQVYAHILGCRSRGATREEVSIALGMRMSTASARCNELLRLGLIIEDGATRPTTSGRQAAVLHAKEALPHG